MDSRHVGRIKQQDSMFFEGGNFPHEQFGTTPQTQPVVENIERAKTVPGLDGLWGPACLKAWRGVQITFAQKIAEGEFDLQTVMAAMAMRGKMARPSDAAMHLFTPEGRTAAAEVWQVTNDLAEFDNLYGILPPAVAMTLRLMFMAYVDEGNQYPEWTGWNADEEIHLLAEAMIIAHTEWMTNVQSNPEQKGVLDCLGPRPPDQINIYLRAREDTEGKQRICAWINLKSTVSEAEETWLKHMNDVPVRGQWRFVKMPNTVLWLRNKPLQHYGVQDNDVLVAYMTKDIKELLKPAVAKRAEEAAHERVGEFPGYPALSHNSFAHVYEHATDEAIESACNASNHGGIPWLQQFAQYVRVRARAEGRPMG